MDGLTTLESKDKFKIFESGKTWHYMHPDVLPPLSYTTSPVMYPLKKKATETESNPVTEIYLFTGNTATRTIYSSPACSGKRQAQNAVNFYRTNNQNFFNN